MESLPANRPKKAHTAREKPLLERAPSLGASVAAASESRSVDDIGIKRLTMASAEQFNDDLSVIGSRKVMNTGKYYICPSNTFVATNGDVYHVEPFQLPPPNEIAALFQELKKFRIRSDSNLSDLGGPVPRSASVPKSDSRDLLLGAHERPGATQRKRFSMDMNTNHHFPPLPHEWLKRGHALPVPNTIPNTIPEERASPVPHLVIPQHSTEKLPSPRLVSPSSRPSSPLANRSNYVTDDGAPDESSFSFTGYIYAEVFGVGEPGQLEPDAIHNIHNFLHVPFKLEGLILFGVFICLDSFLFVLTFLPIRVFFSLLALATELIAYADSVLSGATLKHKFHRTHLYDLMRGCLIFFGFYVLRHLNMSRVYHFIRGQTVLKLYVLTGMLEIFDKLLCTFGQDAFDALYWQTCVQPDLGRVSFAYAVVCFYVVAHSCIYFFHVATLTVAFNSDDQALITVLILNNFSEIKAFVFKKFDKQQLFQLACADITERFILLLFWSLVIIVAVAQAGEGYMKILPNALQVVGLMVCGEAIADSIKHAFISKFNNINASMYQDYGRLLCKDVINASKNKVNLDHTYAISRRVGLSQIPLACVLLRYLSLALSAPAPQAYLSRFSAWDMLALVAFGFVGLCVLKVCVGIGLLTHAIRSYNSDETSQEAFKKKIERNLWMDRLSNIERFTVWKGKIVA